MRVLLSSNKTLKFSLASERAQFNKVIINNVNRILYLGMEPCVSRSISPLWIESIRREERSKRGQPWYVWTSVKNLLGYVQERVSVT